MLQLIFKIDVTELIYCSDKTIQSLRSCSTYRLTRTVYVQKLNFEKNIIGIPTELFIFKIGTYTLVAQIPVSLLFSRLDIDTCCIDGESINCIIGIPTEPSVFKIGHRHLWYRYQRAFCFQDWT